MHKQHKLYIGIDVGFTNSDVVVLDNSTLTMQVSSDCNNMPILNLSFDGQEDPTLTTRLEAFVEQVRQKNTATVTSVLANSFFR